MHPDAIKLYTDLSQELATFNSSKMRIEYLMQAIRDKGLAPNEDGTFPPGLGIQDGTIGGNKSTLNPDDAKLALGGLSAMVGAITQELVPGVTIEAALIRFMGV